ncbi:hypothetical protein [Tenacibaculum xiamenense]|uniref:hypothetical protein n=1 Tax=Tenacibaculum xiamenense TaxID=1261553 RepID=UPI003893AA0C
MAKQKRIRLSKKSIDEKDFSSETNNPFQEENNEKKSGLDNNAPENLIETHEESNPFGFEESNNSKDEPNPFKSESSSDYDSMFDSDTIEDEFTGSSTMNESAEESTHNTGRNSILEIDPEMTYFFVFGNSTAGKSAMLSALLYHMKTSGLGQLRSLSLDVDHHRRGDYILNQMIRKVRKGEFIGGTKLLDTDFEFPTEINLEFQPNGKPSMPFCLLEMAGEDLKEIELRDEGKIGGKFDERIDAYLHHKDCNLKFICVVDVDTPENSEDLIDQFINYIYKIGRQNDPLLLSINKWDTIKDQYGSAKDYINKKLPLLKNHLFDENRDMSYMKFSVGDVVKGGDLESDDTYTFKQEKGADKLLNWMYSIAEGISLEEPEKKSPFESMISGIKKLFSS